MNMKFTCTRKLQQFSAITTSSLMKQSVMTVVSINCQVAIKISDLKTYLSLNRLEVFGKTKS